MRVASEIHGQKLRRGVTLLEMLVVVALLVLMMVIVSSIFQQATSAISMRCTNSPPTRIW